MMSLSPRVRLLLQAVALLLAAVGTLWLSIIIPDDLVGWLAGTSGAQLPARL